GARGPPVGSTAPPPAAYGRVSFCTSTEFYSFARKARARDQTPAARTPTAEGSSAAPARLQVVPADVVLAPGESVTFKARLFDAQGRFLREVEAQWEAASMLPPPPLPNAPPAKGPPPPVLKGTVGADGKLTVDRKVPGQFGGVVAKAGGLEARARVRVAPQLPYVQDFENVPLGRTPGGWVNTQGKFQVIRLPDGSLVLVKLATNP